jgi:hypothetical protein
LPAVAARAAVLGAASGAAATTALQAARGRLAGVSRRVGVAAGAAQQRAGWAEARLRDGLVGAAAAAPTGDQDRREE